jgi:hypothetical protein
LQKTHTKPEDIDPLICATITPDMQFLSPTRSGMIGMRNIELMYRQLLRFLIVTIAAHHRQRHSAQVRSLAPTKCPQRLQRPRHLCAVR